MSVYEHDKAQWAACTLLDALNPGCHFFNTSDHVIAAILDPAVEAALRAAWAERDQAADPSDDIAAQVRERARADAVRLR